jgi:hypoxanthine phosphoribosyltransferase
VETEAEFEVPTWNQIYAMLGRQAEKIRCSGFKPDVIVGVTRGGWVPARVLSDLLGICDLATVGVEFYIGVAETRSEPVLKQNVSADMMGKKALLVDDVADTGKSLHLAKAHLQQQGVAEVRVATVYRKPLSALTPDFYEKETRLWVVFPWDAKENIKKILVKRGGEVNLDAAKLVKAGLPKQLVEELLKEAGEAGKC